ncbi:MAG: ornithine carbamoyltransferase [Stackebrandtia sp.]
MKHFLKDDDLDPLEQQSLIDFAIELKEHRYSQPLLAAPLLGNPPIRATSDHRVDVHVPEPRLFGAPRSIAVVFEKESTRSRTSFQIGITELGGYPVMIDAQTSHLSRGETIADTARVLSRYADAIVMRTFGDERIQEMAAAADVPVINALTDGYHPCQVLADLQTVTEEFGEVSGRTITFVGDTANNMANSYLLGGAVGGAHVRIAGPYGYEPDPLIVETASVWAAETGGSVAVMTDPREAVDGADVVATDTWVSMGHDNRDKRLTDLEPYQLNAELLTAAADHAIVLHCLPAHRGEEITDEVMDGPQSRVFDQAENRLHAQKALMAWLVNDDMDLSSLVEDE